MMRVHEAPLIRNDLVTCVPFNGEHDYEYLIQLARLYKLNQVTEAQARLILTSLQGRFWVIYDTETMTKGGVVLLTSPQGMPEGCYMIDAYKDDKMTKWLGNARPYSYVTMKLILEYTFNTLKANKVMTYHKTQNRGATIICKRLGFKVIGTIESPFGALVAMEKDSL